MMGCYPEPELIHIHQAFSPEHVDLIRQAAKEWETATWDAHLPIARGRPSLDDLDNGEVVIIPAWSTDPLVIEAQSHKPFGDVAGVYIFRSDNYGFSHRKIVLVMDKIQDDTAFLGVITHELGHYQGVDHDGYRPENVMSPIYGGATTLSEADVRQYFHDRRGK